jgi:hypothetical protein
MLSRACYANVNDFWSEDRELTGQLIVSAIERGSGEMAGSY